MGKPGSGGQFAPVNTLKRASVCSTSGSVLEANSKRQRLNPVTPTRIYQPSSRSTHAIPVNDDAPDDHDTRFKHHHKDSILPRREDRERPVDLTNEETGRRKSMIAVVLPVKSRKQRPESISDGESGSPNTNRKARSKRKNEEDELVDTEDPPPATIESDLPGYSRRAPPRPRLQVAKEKKRRRRHGSPDELAQAVSGRQEVDLVDSDAESERISKRGKMTPTKFGGKKERAAQKGLRIPVARAFSNNDIYEVARSVGSQVYLQERFNENGGHAGFEACSDRDPSCPDMEWLSLDPVALWRVLGSQDGLILFAKRKYNVKAGAELIVQFSAGSDVRPLWDLVRSYPGLKDPVTRNLTHELLTKKLDEGFARAEAQVEQNLSRSRQNHSTHSAQPTQVTSRDNHGPRETRPLGRLTRFSSPEQPDQDSSTNGASELRTKLKDQMDGDADRVEPTETAPKRSLRQQGREPYKEELLNGVSSGLLPEVQDKDRWSLQEDAKARMKTWDQPLIYPPTGRNRTTVDKEDIVRLDEGEFLNDNLINFYFRYVQDDAEKKASTSGESRRPSVYMFSTFFYEKLRSTGGKYVNFDGVKSWTAKIDIFEYDYLLVPVNEHAHWYLAIIYNPSKLLPTKSDTPQSELSPLGRQLSSVTLTGDEPSHRGPSSLEAVKDTVRNQEEITKKGAPPSQIIDAKTDPNIPRIITLDSLGNAHVTTARALRQYLQEEAKHKKNIDLETEGLALTPKIIPYRASKAAPEQPNFWDCGVYVLEYAKRFLEDPSRRARQFLEPNVEPTWKFRSSDLRKTVRQLILTLHEGQQVEAKKAEEEKQKRKAAAKARVAGAAETPPETKVATSQTETKKEETPPVDTSDIKNGTPSRTGHSKHTRYRLGPRTAGSQIVVAEGSEQSDASENAATLPSPQPTATTVVDGAVATSPKGDNQDAGAAPDDDDEVKFIAPLSVSPETNAVSTKATSEPSPRQASPKGDAPIELSDDEDHGSTSVKERGGTTLERVRDSDGKSPYFGNKDDEAVIVTRVEKLNRTPKGGAKYDGVGGTPVAAAGKGVPSLYPDAEC